MRFCDRVLIVHRAVRINRNSARGITDAFSVLRGPCIHGYPPLVRAYPGMISFEAIINSLEEAVILFDRETSITFLNKTAEELIGRGSKDIFGKKASHVFRGEKSFTPLIKKTIAEGRSFRGRSVSLDIGQGLDIDFILSPFFSNNRIEGAVLSISENIHIAERGDYDFDSVVYLIGTIAHEIKNPLGGIKGAAQLLRHKTHNASIDEYTELIIRETDRLNAILHGYLTICKKPSFNPVNVHEVLEKAIAIIDISIKKAGISMSRLYDPSLPQVRGDEAKLLQVFLNITKNAVESMKRGGRLEIATYPSHESVRAEGKMKRWAVIAVRDTGKGIPARELQKIFMPFYTKKKDGTGIGLAFSKKIIKDHGGLIKVRSEPGKGSTFLIYIPFESNEQ